jgi:prophage maintenance system killer protein
MAAKSCYQSFGGQELFPGVIEMAALLALLRLNDVVISYTSKDLVAIGLGLADGSFAYEAIAQWVRYPNN